MLISLGEMAVFAPVTGGAVFFAERFVDKALGFAIGYNLAWGGAFGLPTEITASGYYCQL